eukprot:scaffold638_cov382-Prasinococcus_capsulatus_cf.AAC.10
MAYVIAATTAAVAKGCATEALEYQLHACASGVAATTGAVAAAALDAAAASDLRTFGWQALKASAASSGAAAWPTLAARPPRGRRWCGHDPFCEGRGAWARASCGPRRSWRGRRGTDARAARAQRRACCSEQDGRMSSTWPRQAARRRSEPANGLPMDGEDAANCPPFLPASLRQVSACAWVGRAPPSARHRSGASRGLRARASVRACVRAWAPCAHMQACAHSEPSYDVRRARLARLRPGAAASRRVAGQVGSAAVVCPSHHRRPPSQRPLVHGPAARPSAAPERRHRIGGACLAVTRAR